MATVQRLIEMCSAGAVAWAAMATTVRSANAAVAMMILSSLSTACSDVVVDSIVVERSRGEPQVWLRPPHLPVVVFFFFGGGGLPLVLQGFGI
jgi:BT1 family